MFYGVTDLATFILGTVFIVLLPGPNSLYVMAAASRWGVRAGYQGAAGIFVGDDQNDLPAVKYFHGYTVETAEPFMKEAATAVYPSVGDMLLAHL